MCIKHHQEYTECRHVHTKLINCPTYHKQRVSVNGLFSCLFNNNEVKNRKNCGRIVPHYSDPRPFCQACIIRNERLGVRHIGDGALRVQRPVVEENFGRRRDENRKECKAPARELREKPERRHRGHKRRNSETINSKPSVWIPELYHHPEAMARREAYCRGASEAPPVCPSRPHKPSTCQYSSDTSKRSTDKTREGHSRGAYECSSDGVGRNPMFGSSRSLNRPVEPAPTYRYRGRFARDKSELPPLPPHALRRGDNIQPIPASEHPRLRHKIGRVYNISVPRPNFPEIPLPEYQVYLNALSFASNKPDAQKITRMAHQSSTRPKPTPKGRYYTHENPKTASLARLGKAIGIESPHSPMSDEGSDLSFVCTASKRLTQKDQQLYGSQ
ncbi:hypothetical protein F4779DRAFT_505810 [Xylariaceae sp. FL0662B]|nr:hypothetical protein F4779DRAFT_505810 [Xylariaceae sp. FL0662B]